MTERAEKDLFRFLQHECGIDALNLHLAVDEGTHAVVGADRNRKLQFAHAVSFRD
jgi:hypothetical protein